MPVNHTRAGSVLAVGSAASQIQSGGPLARPAAHRITDGRHGRPLGGLAADDPSLSFDCRETEPAEGEADEQGEERS